MKPSRVPSSRSGALTVSVVIPARDEEERIAACLEALLEQDEPADEIIVVDNGSTDATPRIAAELGATVIAEPRPGISVARSTGFDRASGDVLARIDADTIVPTDWVGRLRAIFAADPSLDAVGGAASQVESGPAVQSVSKRVYEAFRELHEVTMGAGPLLYGHNMALRAEAWRRIRGVVTLDDEQISEDVDVALAILATGGNVRYVEDLEVEADVVRTLKPAKLAKYVRRDALTREKYRDAD